MVTASHNEKRLDRRPRWARRGRSRFGPDEMDALKKIALDGKSPRPPRGSYKRSTTFRRVNLDDVTANKNCRGRSESWPLAATARPGSSRRSAQTHGATDPLDTNLDFTFPRYQSQSRRP